MPDPSTPNPNEHRYQTGPESYGTPPQNPPAYDAPPVANGAPAYPGTPTYPAAPVYPAAPAYPASPAYPAAPAGQGQYGYTPAPPTNTMAILSLIFAFVFNVLGIVFGHIALNQIKTRGEGGKGLALAGLIVGYASLGLTLLWLAFIFIIVASTASYSY